MAKDLADPKTLLIIIVIMLLLVMMVTVIALGAMRRPPPAIELTPVVTQNIRVEFPRAGEIVRKQFTVTGEARADWFFEGTFPIRLVDGQGRLLSQSFAMALDRQSGENFTRFQSPRLEFATPMTPDGTLILIRAEKAGRTEIDRDVKIPLRFK